ncbi:hypothetical protein CBM2592_B20102 [Cupriavidus taiwanensis]|nr:hypothetical protein CBM2592_B20102 [Cupriavidus taiwanensis]SOY92320.1 hypothetical protein CBM2591_B10393 [Cupriavidus taiwanensis]SOZ74086.1 hypothetical protein CBM2617_B30075 [Cupriavidus taiwanensis]SOZ90843.1 hypothetical protein CBM2622_B30074 [Cupriavidus taiwanensis]SPA52022.1 hypothetical protein CBM2629_B20101 [Cupriavidus taiwanensis]
MSRESLRAFAIVLDMAARQTQSAATDNQQI